MTIIKKIWFLFERRQRILALLLLAATLLGSVLEALGIGLIIPLIKLINDSSAINSYPWLMRLAAYFGNVTSHRSLIIFICTFLIFFVFKSVYIVSLGYFQIRFVSGILHSISCRLFSVYLRSSWSFYLKRNSAELMNNIVNQVGLLCTGFLASIVTLITESLITLSILALILFVDPLSTIIAMSFLGLTSLLFVYITHKKLEYFGARAQMFSAMMIKTVNEAFGGIKETKVLGREDYFIRSYSQNNLAYSQSWIYNNMTTQYQRSAIEMLFVGGILGVSLFALYRGQATSSLLSTLTLFAAAAFRLMPAINRINNAIGSIKFYKPVLETIHRDIQLPVEKETVLSYTSQEVAEPLKFQKSIKIQNLSFRYPDTNKAIIKEVSISIPKGHSVGFVGPSGAGKTTTVDVILGLLRPTSGQVLVDGHDIFANLTAWQQLIGYIPQNIYLSDNSIRSNVAFGVNEEEINDEKVWSALKGAQLYYLVSTLPEGLDTMVGERGIRLSGGQRQRIGIARALYHNPQVLVLDEATSSLDTETEKEIADAIDCLTGEKTLIIIAHRLSTLEKCDILYEVRNGNIFEKRNLRFGKKVPSVL